MSNSAELLGTYLHLANASRQRRRDLVADRLLVIASVIAHRSSLPRIADYCRRLILEHNPHHMVSKWSTVAEAFDDTDFQHLARQVFRKYPQETAERLLADLQIERGRELEVYVDTEEYAASLLGVSRERLEELFGS